MMRLTLSSRVRSRARTTTALVPLALVGAACGDVREFDCAAIATAYASGCSDHLAITADTSACGVLRDRQGATRLAASIARAARVCESAGAESSAASAERSSQEVCDQIFVCVADPDGLSALTGGARVTGTPTVKGQRYAFDAPAAWAWLGTKGSGSPGDFAVLFHHAGHPWFFRLDDLALRADTHPFVVDALRPIKLESVVDNLELTTGTVLIAAFAVDGVFDVTATTADGGNGQAIDVRIQGDFASP